MVYLTSFLVWQNILGLLTRCLDIGSDFYMTHRYYERYQANTTYNYTQRWNETMPLSELTKNINGYEMFWSALIILIMTFFGQVVVHFKTPDHWATISGYCCQKAAWNALKRKLQWRHLFAFLAFLPSCIFAQITYFVNNQRVKTFAKYWTEKVEDSMFPDPKTRCNSCVDCPDEKCLCLYCARNANDSDLVVATQKKSDANIEFSDFVHVALEDFPMVTVQFTLLFPFVYQESIESLTFEELPSMITDQCCRHTCFNWFY